MSRINHSIQEALPILRPLVLYRNVSENLEVARLGRPDVGATQQTAIRLVKTNGHPH
ncbi:hypothetical protein [Paraburkholderia sediminicola]|uniref:hypothetical protein n=1 Tax=Paraburkholderia sediminicola TaxID=458836 RepID=UPI0038B7B801